MRPSPNRRCPKGLLEPHGIALVLVLGSSTSPAQDKPAPSVDFDAAANKALAAMEKRACELQIKGVAVVAYSVGESMTAWSSKMLVVGHMIAPAVQDKKGSNFLGIAYTKAAEMADTLRDSGSGVRPPLIGEYGWQGGVVAKGKTGTLIAAFSGGPSEEDVMVSEAGMEFLAEAL
jgi:hypothetical protein